MRDEEENNRFNLYPDVDRIREEQEIIDEAAEVLDGHYSDISEHSFISDVGNEYPSDEGDDDFRDVSGISELPPSTIDYVNEYLSDDNSNGDVPDGFAPYPNIPFDASPNIGPIQFPPAAAPILNGDDNDFLSDITSRAAPDFLSDYFISD